MATADDVAEFEANTKTLEARRARESLVISRQGNYSLFCLSEQNCVRRAATVIVESRAFDIFILATIIANCVVLALDAPLPSNDKSAISDELEKSEIFFLVIFTIEAILKIVALGFVLHPGSYLRNGWNILDFIVVITGYISLRQFGNDSFGDVKPLRAVRVLRPLKLVSGTPSLQVVMKSIMRAMVPLLQVLILTMFVIVIYATVGLSFLVDKFHATCYNNITDEIVPVGETVQPCDYKSNGMFTGRQCNSSNNEICRQVWAGPNGGISTFDNILLAILTVSQCITMEGWTDVMYSTFYATDSESYFYTIYYVSLILIGSFFMLNLVLGVLSGEFAKERERVETRRNFFKLRREQKVDREVEQYLEWISRAEEIIVEDLVTRQNEGETDSNQNRPIPPDFVFNPISILAVDGGQVPRLNLAERHKRFPRFRLKERLMRIRVRRLVKHEGFFWAVVIIVLLNTISLATEHYNQQEWMTEFQDKAEIMFLSIFVMEMLLKIYGLGPSTYFRSTFNTFDFVVIIFGLFELIIQKPLGISVLRCLRLLRIFKMTSYWSSLRNLVRSLVSSIKSILSLLFLLFLFVVIFALLGMQFFGGKFVSDTEQPRTNFDDFPNAMLAVFQILTGEDWNSVMYHGIDAYGGAKDPKGLACGLYFVLLVIIGNYTLLNVFLAIAVDNLANAHVLTEDEENERLKREARNEQLEGSERKTSHWQEIGNMTKTLALVKSWTSDPPTEETHCDANGEDGVDGSSTSNGRTKKELTKNLMKNINKYRKAIGDDQDVEAQQPDPHQSHREGATRRRSEGQTVTRALKGRKSKVRKLKKKVPIIRVKSLFLFGPENKFRRVCHYIVNLRHFDNFMLVVIICSSILLAVEDPVDEYSERNKVIRYFDYIFTSIFAFEVFVKLIDLGAVLHPGSYFRSKWNFIDALVVCCNIASLVLSQTQSNVSGQYFVKVLRVLRVFRPLKMMNKLKKLEAVFRCMWYSFKNVANILLITVLFLFIFAVIGVQLFQGKFFYCTDPSKMFEDECKGQYFEYNQGADNIDLTNQVKVKERLWKLRDFHFNNVFHAMLTLYTSATGEGWPSAMQHTMDVTALNQGPIRNYSVENALFYISFVVVFSFFFLNIFVALVILTFQEQGEKELVNSELDRNQRDCISFVIRAKPSETFMPADKKTWSYKVWLVVVSKPFELFIMALIILNTIVLMMEYYDQPDDYMNMCNYFNAALTFLFTMEAALKLFAFKLSYFRDSWNVFDFIVVVGSILDTSLTFGKTYDLPFDPSMFRLFRAARLIKILKQGAGIRVLLWTFLQSFKALPYVTLLIFLVFFIYAVIGMQIFGKIKLDDSTQINKYNNFQDIARSLLLLFRSSTGENWQEIMLSCSDGAMCDERANPQSKTCGSTTWAIAYFCTFIFLCMFFMLNLFVAVIMDNFEYLTRDQSILGPHHLDEFVQIWSAYDPAATGEIHYSKVYEMMTRLSPPVGFGKKCPKMVAYKRLIKMNMPLDENETIQFTTTLFALVRTSLQIRMTGNMNANDTKLRKMITQDWPNIMPRVLDKMIPKQS
ncbi:voltage-dependent N-type calcium channel subunit alpha-1B-like isoform X1, partial [Paramuricea clavata]